MSRAILCILAVALLAVGLAMAWRTAGAGRGVGTYAADNPKLAAMQVTELQRANAQLAQVRAMGWAVLGLLAAIAVVSLGRQLVATRRVVVFQGDGGQDGP